MALTSLSRAGVRCFDADHHACQTPRDAPFKLGGGRGREQIG